MWLVVGVVGGGGMTSGLQDKAAWGAWCGQSHPLMQGVEFG